MVKGIDIFQEYFNEYTDQYVLIGGAACSVSFEEQDINFGRTTKDLDIVLIVEAQTKEFGERFWKFIKDGKYRIRAKSNGEPQFYRFDKPEWIIPFKAKAWLDLREKKDVDSSDIKNIEMISFELYLIWFYRNVFFRTKCERIWRNL